MTFAKVIIFSLMTVAVFTIYSNFGVPQIKPALPNAVKGKVDGKKMTIERFILLGKDVYEDKGSCLLCHNEMGRAPVLDSIVSISEKRIKEAGYQGIAATAEEYIYESLVNPSAYVVEGFGTVGSGDKESPMPDMSEEGMGLSDLEIRALIAFLMDKEGLDATLDTAKAFSLKK